MGNTCGALVAALRREERHAPGPQYTRLGQSEPEGKEHTERGIDAPAVVRNLGQPLRIVTEMGGSTESSIGGASMHGSMEGVSRRRWGLDVDLSRPGDDRTTGLAGTAFAGAGGGSTGFDPSGTGKEQQSNSYGAVAAAAATAAAAAERGFHKGMRVSLLQKHCVVDSVLAVFQCKHSRFASGSRTGAAGCSRIGQSVFCDDTKEACAMLAGLRGNPACADLFSEEDLRRYEAEMMTRLTVDLDNIKAKKIKHIGRGSATNHITALILSTGRKGDFLEATGGGGITPVDFFPEWNDPPEALPTLGGNCVHLRGALRKLQVVSELPDTATKEQRSTAGAEATSAVFRESTDNSAAMVQMAAYFKHGDQFLAKVHDPITGQWRESDVITLDLDRAHIQASRAVLKPIHSHKQIRGSCSSSDTSKLEVGVSRPVFELLIHRHSEDSNYDDLRETDHKRAVNDNLRKYLGAAMRKGGALCYQSVSCLHIFLFVRRADIVYKVNKSGMAAFAAA